MAQRRDRWKRIEKQLPESDRRWQIEDARQTEQLIEQITAAGPKPTEDEISAYLKNHAHEFMGGDAPPESLTPLETVREHVRVLLTAAGKNDLLSAFIARLRKDAVIEEAESRNAPMINS